MQNPCFRVLTSRQKLHNQAVSALVYDAEGQQLISASKDGMVIVWDEWANPIRQYAPTLCQHDHTALVMSCQSHLTTFPHALAAMFI